MSVMRHDEKKEHYDASSYHTALDRCLKGDFQFDLKRGNGDMLYANDHSDNFTISTAAFPTLESLLQPLVAP